ncbi:hypothetical protein [Propionivibrio sp.]|uniref:hypothetical protein n=1 Tax=Propionivibrio sp. TaxID=2212460 RepID=UPI003BF30B7B
MAITADIWSLPESIEVREDAELDCARLAIPVEALYHVRRALAEPLAELDEMRGHVSIDGTCNRQSLAWEGVLALGRNVRRPKHVTSHLVRKGESPFLTIRRSGLLPLIFA